MMRKGFRDHMPIVLSSVLLILLGVLLMRPISVRAETTADGFEYDVYGNDHIRISGYTGSGGSVTVPSTIDGLPVTIIDPGTFQNKIAITHITLPNTVTSIWWGQFMNCTSLVSVTIPSSVTQIASDAFSGCSSLTSLVLPENVTSIGNNIVNGCSSLARITIKNASAEVQSLSLASSTYTRVNSSCIIYCEANSDVANHAASLGYTVKPLSESPDVSSGGGSGSSSGGSGSSGGSLPNTAADDLRFPILILFIISLASSLTLGLIKRKAEK